MSRRRMNSEQSNVQVHILLKKLTSLTAFSLSTDAIARTSDVVLNLREVI